MGYVRYSVNYRGNGLTESSLYYKILHAFWLFVHQISYYTILKTGFLTNPICYKFFIIFLLLWNFFLKCRIFHIQSKKILLSNSFGQVSWIIVLNFVNFARNLHFGKCKILQNRLNNLLNIDFAKWTFLWPPYPGSRLKQDTVHGASVHCACSMRGSCQNLLVS